VGECSLAYVKALDTVILSGLDRFKKQAFDFLAPVTEVACGDEFLAVLTANNMVSHLGGLFENPPPHTFFKLPLPTETKRCEVTFFPGKVLKLFGKYSYYCALIED